jgi:hypothetical protein
VDRMTLHTDTIARYFEISDARDVDAYVGLFAPDAVVHDDGHTHVGLDEIRAWRSNTIPVRSDVLDVSDTTARVRITGDFPGSPVVLGFRFGFDDAARITTLAIAV